MNARIEDRIGKWFAVWVEYTSSRAGATVAAIGLASVALAVFTATHLGVNLDNKRLLASDLPFLQSARAFQRYFPSLDDALLIVIDAETPELARTAAARLSTRLAQSTDVFKDVFFPAGETFFERHALLYRSPEELGDLSDHLARVQPLLADLSRNASIASLANLVRLALEQSGAQQVDEHQWAGVLDKIAEGTVRVYDEFPVSVSWEEMILTGSALDPGRRQVIIAEPVLDFDKLLAADVAISTIREAAAALELTPERGVRLRITGNPALNYEEMLALAWDVGVSGIFSFFFVSAVLFLAFRSLRLVLAAAVALLTGLLWTAAFAAVSVEHLNLLSIAFGVLFIGLGVDFLIHLGMSYADGILNGVEQRAALRRAVEEVGGSLFVCALTTAIGFFAFTPTDYRGVAELGIIAGGSMFIILFLAMTFFPSLIVLLVGESARRSLRAASQLHLAPPRVVATHPGTVALLCGALLGAALVVLPRIQFDSNVIQMRDPDTESVQAFNDLLERSDTSPWYADAMTASLAEARSTAARLSDVDLVATTVTVDDYVPKDQDEKREILADAAFLLDAPPGPARRIDLPVEQQIAALRALHTTLDLPWLEKAGEPLAGSARQLRDVLGRFLAGIDAKANPQEQLAQLETILLGQIPEQLQRLQRALSPQAIELETLPAHIRERMLAADGHARIQIFPKENLSDTAALTRFVDAVRDVAPDATGVAVNIVEFGRTTVTSLLQAFVYALASIILVLWLLQGRVDETALVLSPVLLGGAFSGAAMVLLGLSFNFTNVVVLPLLLGIGVDSGIHLVYRARSVGGDENVLLETTTARAVFFSALTTIASFGSLAFSGHRGISSLGVVLVCSMVLVLAANLVFLPALLQLRKNWQSAG